MKVTIQPWILKILCNFTDFKYCTSFCTSKPVQSPSHLRYISSHRFTRQYSINQANVVHAASRPLDHNLDYEMQSMGHSTGSANHTLYVEAASVEMPLGYEMPQSTVCSLAQ